MDKGIFKKISEVCFEIPKNFKPQMRVPARIFVTEKLLEKTEEQIIEQITNVATLPGIADYALAMSDCHPGYGFPIGGVAAFDLDKGVISPGGIGFDINCGIRILVSNLKYDDLKGKIKDLVEKIFYNVPSGVGRAGFVSLTKEEFKKVMIEGAKWCVSHGLGEKEDLLAIEDGGCLEGADPENVSSKAIERGIEQVGSLGSGNHYLEIEIVNKIFDKEKAEKYGIFEPGQVAITIHSGSRGFGHQIATDYLREFQSVMGRYGIKVNDPELACAPFKSPEGQRYFSAAKCAANTAYANRQALTAKVREVMATFLGISQEKLGLKLIADVCHNIAKIENFGPRTKDLGRGKNLEQRTKDLGQKKTLLVHRKGATRSYPGKPIILGGSMEFGSYLMEGTEKALEETFGSTAHGAGRVMSRAKAKKIVRGDRLVKDLEARGIYVRTSSFPGLAEEAGIAYKNLDEVVYTIEKAGLSKSVASFSPVGNIKG